MSKFTVEIHTDGAAFEDNEVGELVRILARVTADLASGWTNQTLFDLNGNRVGSAQFEAPCE